MQKRFKYSIKAFDIETGAFGEVEGDCIYNHDEDYYFKKLVIRVIRPEKGYFILLDKGNTIDI